MASQTDYKFARIVRSDADTVVVARVYEGETETLDEPDNDGNLVPVTRYRRSVKLREFTATFRANLTDGDIRDAHDQRLVDDDAGSPKRKPIPEQDPDRVR